MRENMGKAISKRKEKANMKHTPVDECQMCHSVEHSHRSIALGYGVICDGCLPKLRKIADAAPDLLEACKEVVNDAIWDGKEHPNNKIEYLIKIQTIEKVRQAIAKAEGR
jgi:hypothetical protein